jgi:hypothetical protein
MRIHFPVPVLPLLMAACVFFNCGGDSPTGSASGGSGFTAKVEGKDWEAIPISIVAQTNFGVTGALMILGSQTIGGTTISLTITVYNVGGKGKYPLGVGSSVFGGIGQLGEGSGNGNANSWITDASGAAGMAEITSVSDGRIAGTFSYLAGPGKNNTVGGNRTVTEGRFDLALKGTLLPLPEGLGCSVSAEFNGEPYYAGTVNGFFTDFTGGAGLQFSSITSLHGLSINLVGVTEPGTYALSNTAPQRLMTAGRNNGPAGSCCWGVNAPGDVGEITVTSITAKRMQGTFTATLKPQPGKPATEDLVIRNGKFDVGVP